ncbi:ATP-binding protein [Acetivibrio cellulolyticus]|uniref:ATP-binding protein n=1 Tax=Acetivibrio cellulolyticus TaxID=35830 RepID=UPI0001E2F5C0|nr:ATP-binding protein [Acetivibrio cellulolyticus]
MYKNINVLIQNEYDKRQKDIYDELILRKEEIYSKIPRIEEIDNAIQFTGIKYTKMILQDAGVADSLVNELRDKLDNLKNEKALLLNEFSYPSDYLDPKYHCISCKDTGYISSLGKTEKCACYKQKYIDNLYNQSNLKLALYENFTKFDVSYYPDVVDEVRYGIRISPRNNISKIKERVANFVDNIDSPDNKNLFFSGPTGVGKTFMINCLAAELLNRGRTVLYQTAPSLFTIINEYKLKNFKETDYEDSSYDNIFEVEVLIIDDLGTESPSAARYAELLNILNSRQDKNLERPCKTIIATNMGVGKLNEYYDERVASRIIGSFDLFKFAGEDIRMLKKNGPTP